MFTIAETEALSSPHFREGYHPNATRAYAAELHPERKNSC